MTVPSAWTGLGRMSQARSRYQDELGLMLELVQLEIGCTGAGLAANNEAGTMGRWMDEGGGWAGGERGLCMARLVAGFRKRRRSDARQTRAMGMQRRD